MRLGQRLGVEQAVRIVLARRGMGIALCVAVAVTSNGCSLLQKDGGSDAGSKPQGANSEDPLVTKVQAYFDQCAHVFSERMHDSERRYARWVNPSKGPLGNEQHVYGVYDIPNDPNDCARAVLKLNASTPHDALLEKTASEYVTALVKASAVTNEAYAYYDRDSYKDDHFAKGRALHAPLMAAWSQFDKVDSVFRGRIEDVEDALDLRQLTALEAASTKNLRWHVLHTRRATRALARAGRLPLEQIDLAKLALVTDAAQAAVSALVAYTRAHPDERGHTVMVESYADDAQKVATAGTKLVRRLRDHTKFTAFEANELLQGFLVDGSPQQLADAYVSSDSMYRNITWNV